MELTKQFSEREFAAALESWAWLDLDGKAARFTSLFGDVFLESADGARWFLDTFEGQLIRGWGSRADLTAELDTEDGQDRYLLAPSPWAHTSGAGSTWTPVRSTPTRHRRSSREASTSIGLRCSASSQWSTPPVSSTDSYGTSPPRS
ncbi:hypothetical protein AB0B20_12935 [Micromonospora sp. NPDC049151]|uniref:hypothetical protein n=1 Tax=Micromonospora sp. NPDC049151 TaxID=3155648 RepID=UPI0033F742F5